MTGAQIAAAARRQSTVIPRRSGRETAYDRGFIGLMIFALFIAFLGLAAIIYDFAVDGIPVVSWDFITSFPSRVIPSRAGIQSAIVGTIYLMILTALFVIPIGVMTAVYLEEYADRDRWLHRVIEVNIQNLAAVPSVVYGILGLAFIVRGPLGLGPVLLAGAITLTLLVIGAGSSLRFNPSGLDSSFTALPVQIFTWTQDPNQESVTRAAGAIVVLMVLLLLMNSVAIWLRNRYEQKW